MYPWLGQIVGGASEIASLLKIPRMEGLKHYCTARGAFCIATSLAELFRAAPPPLYRTARLPFSIAWR